MSRRSMQLVTMGLALVGLVVGVAASSRGQDSPGPKATGQGQPHGEASPSSTELPATGWIWSQGEAHQHAPRETVWFRLDFDLPARPDEAEVLLTADNAFKLYVNGHLVAEGNNWKMPVRRDVAGALQAGRNSLAVEATNTAPSPAGLYLEGVTRAGGREVVLSTGEHWRWSGEAQPGWHTLAFDASPWAPAAVLGERDMAPWSIGQHLGRAVSLMPLGPPTDWKTWRERVRDELANLDAPADPPGDPDVHPVDRFLSAWWEREGIAPPPTCDDATFVRRAYLDAVGLLPTETELEAFLSDERPDRRERLIERLLADEVAYAEGGMAWWCDLLRNDEQTNIDNLRQPITRWLFAALRSNMPYDRMVAELLNPGFAGPEGYLKGVNWRGRVNASQRPPLQAAQNVGQVFLGTNIKCASCHDHFTRPYMLDDAYGLASFFSEENLEIFRCDQPTGVTAAPEFHFADVGTIPPGADLPTKLRTVSRMVTTPENPRFARTMVNRLWKKLMGWGLVEPVDDYDATASHPELLDWLAHEFIRQDYDLKVMIRLLMTSRGYQLATAVETADAVRAGEQQAPIYVGPPLRRLTSEEFLDALGRLTGYWPDVPTMACEVPNEHIRAWRHRRPDELALALGRPTREQVATVREDEASMLQMLEMVNGTVLTERLSEGAAVLLDSPLGRETNPDAVLDVLYRRAYSRSPTETEASLLRPLVGTPGDDHAQRQADWADLCWMLVMSPEFQFIR